jgi:hypothetical protein
MALLTGVLGGGAAETLCSAAHVSPLSGMVTMYLLMSAFHAAPWLKLIRARARRSAIGRSANVRYEERSRMSGTGARLGRADHRLDMSVHWGGTVP